MGNPTPLLKTMLILGVLGILGTLVVPWSKAVRGAGGTMYFSPSTKGVTPGTTFTVNVLVNTGGQAINAAEATIAFPSNLLSLQSISKNGSVFTLWAVEPAGSNGSGTITFSGGLPSPGFSGGSGRIISLVFRAVKAGSAKLTISGAQLLANDGLGTNIFSGAGNAVFTIAEEQQEPQPTPQPSRPAPTITATSHRDQNAWSPQRTVQATWRAGSGALGYHAIFDQTATTVPSESSSSAETSFSRENLADGIWYLHVRARYDGGWSSTAHYAFRIDATSPEPFQMTLTHEKETDRTVTLDFAATDATSGIDRYEVKVDDGTFYTAISPVGIGDLLPGTHTFVVRAYDKAGNTAETKETVEVIGPPAPLVFLVDSDNAILTADAVLTLLLGTPIRLHGYAKLGDTIRIVVRSAESVFAFPVEDIIDPSPIEPAPPGFTAWKVELRPDLSPGDHEIHVTAISEEGLESAAAPVLRFKVVTDAVRVGSTLVAYRVLVLILLAAAATFFLLAVLFFILWLRLRHRSAHRRRSS